MKRDLAKARAWRQRSKPLTASLLKSKRKPLPPMSERRKRENRERARVLDSLRGQACEVMWDGNCRGVGVTLHEPLLRSRGGDATVREGNLWTCAQCHDAIHANPREATERGFMRHEWERAS